jgi:hypothetical protein
MCVLVGVKVPNWYSGSADARAWLWGGIWKTVKSGYVSYRYVLWTFFFFFFFRAQNILASSLTSNHAIPIGNPHTSMLVTMSAFTRKNVHPSGSRDWKCTSSTSKRLSVWAKNILGSSLMMVHDGHTGQTAYRCVRHRAWVHEHPKTP